MMVISSSRSHCYHADVVLLMPRSYELCRSMPSIAIADRRIECRSGAGWRREEPPHRVRTDELDKIYPIRLSVTVHASDERSKALMLMVAAFSPRYHRRTTITINAQFASW
jgi:hypothetical protein